MEADGVSERAEWAEKEKGEGTQLNLKLTYNVKRMRNGGDILKLNLVRDECMNEGKTSEGTYFFFSKVVFNFFRATLVSLS